MSATVPAIERQASSIQVAKRISRYFAGGVAGLACAAGFALLPAVAVHAQDAAAAAATVAQRWNFPQKRRARNYGYVWPFAGAMATRFSPVSLYSGIDQFLQRARAGSYVSNDLGGAGHPTVPTPAQMALAPRVETDDWNEIRNRLAERRPDLQDGSTGEVNVISFIKYRLPWLNTPESAVHALPTISLRSGTSVRFDVMGGVIAGRSGAYGQLVVQF